MTSLRNNSIKTRGGVEDTRLKAKDIKNFEAKAKNRPPRGQGPRTQTQVFSKRKVFKIFFQAISKKVFKIFFRAKKVFKNFFQAISTWGNQKKVFLQIFRKVSGVFQRNFNGSKIVLSSSRGQGNFRGLEASRPRTSKCGLEASDVLGDSTSYENNCFCVLTPSNHSGKPLLTTSNAN